MKSARPRALGAIAVATTMLLTSLGTATASPVARQSAATTTIVWSTSPSGTAFESDVASAFNKANPGVKVVVQDQSADSVAARAQLVTDLSARSSTPDVYAEDQTWPGEDVLNHWDFNLTKLIPKSLLTTMPPGLVAGYSYQGALLAVPYFSDAILLYYRKDILTKYHMKIPTTFQQLNAEGEQLQKDKAVKYGLVYFGGPNESSTMLWCSLINDAGGQTVNSDGTKAAVDSPAGLTVMTWARSTITSGLSPSAESTFGPTEPALVFDQGSTAFMVANAYQWPDIAEAGMENKVGVALPPTFAGGPRPGASCAGGNAAYINPYSKHIADDIKFAEFLASRQVQLLEAKVGHLQPALVSVETDPSVDAVDPPAALLPRARIINRPANTKYYAALSRATYSNWSAVIAGTETPKTGLQDMANQVNLALKGNV